MRGATRITVLAAAALCAKAASPVGALDAQIGWTSVQGATGYRVYVRQATESYDAGIDVGALQTHGDGIVRYIYNDVPVGVSNYFAVSAYDASGQQSALSNELALVVAADCAATPVPDCLTSGRSRVSLRGTGGKNRLQWKWLKGTASSADFGDPVNGSSTYRLCVYDAVAGAPSLKLGVSVPAGGVCNGKACWKQSGAKTASGFRYRDSALEHDGLQVIKLKAGPAGKAKIIVRGKGANLPTSGAFAQDTDVTVQLLKSDGGVCWQAVYPAPAVKSSGDRFTDQTP